VTGERPDQAGWSDPCEAGPRGPGEQAEFTSSSGGVRASPVTRKGTWRRGTMRNRSEPGQVARTSFEFGRIAVTPRVAVATAHQHGARRPDGCRKGTGQTKDAERRDKMGGRTGKNTGPGQGSENTSGTLAMLKTAPPACERKQLESQEVRPVAPGQRIAKSDGRPGANGGDADKIASVSLPGPQAGGCNHQLKRA